MHHHTVCDMQLNVSSFGVCFLQAESKAMIERRGKGLLLSVKQINAVLRA